MDSEDLTEVEEENDCTSEDGHQWRFVGYDCDGGAYFKCRICHKTSEP